MNIPTTATQSSSTGQRRPGWMGWLLVMPLFVWLAAFVVAPTLIMAVYSIYQHDELGEPYFAAPHSWNDFFHLFDSYHRVFNYHFFVSLPLNFYLVPLLFTAVFFLLGAVYSVVHYQVRDVHASPFFLLFTLPMVTGFGFEAVRYAAMVPHVDPDDQSPIPAGVYVWNMLSESTLHAVFIALFVGIIGTLILFFGKNRTYGWIKITLTLVIAPLLSATLWSFYTSHASDLTQFRILLRSIYYAAGTTLICVLAGYPVAYYIGRAKESSRNRLLLLIMVPFWTSFLIRTYAWIAILREKGMLNAFLISSGIVRQPLEILYTPAAIMIGLVYAYLPFMILPIYGSVEKLDNSYIEAALDLGASPWKTFTSVIVPLTRPGIVAGVLLVFIPAIGMFAIQDLMGGSKILMVGNEIQLQFLGASRDWPFGAALGITLMALFCLAYWVAMNKVGDEH